MSNHSRTGDGPSRSVERQRTSLPGKLGAHPFQCSGPTCPGRAPSSQLRRGAFPGLNSAHDVAWPQGKMRTHPCCTFAGPPGAVTSP